jgi:hypothetical protein
VGGQGRRPDILSTSRTVIVAVFLWQLGPAILAAEEGVPGIKRLDGATKAKALAALAALIILGFAMIALAWLGARVVQRYRHRQPYLNPTPRPSEHDWAKKPLADPDSHSAGSKPTRDPADD